MQTFPNSKKSTAVKTVAPKTKPKKAKKTPMHAKAKPSKAATPEAVISAAESITKSFGNPKQSVEALRKTLEKRREVLNNEYDQLTELKGAVEDQIQITDEAREGLNDAIEALGKVA